MKSKIDPFVALFILTSSVHAVPKIKDVVAGDGATIIAGSGASLGDHFNTNAYAFTGPGGITDISESGSGNREIRQNEEHLWRDPPLNGGAVIKAGADSTTGNITVADEATFALADSLSDGSGQATTLTGQDLSLTNHLFGASFNQRGALQSHTSAST